MTTQLLLIAMSVVLICNKIFAVSLFACNVPSELKRVVCECISITVEPNVDIFETHRKKVPLMFLTRLCPD